MMRNRVLCFSVVIAAAAVIALSSPYHVSSRKLGVTLSPAESDQTQEETSRGDVVVDINGLQKRGEKKPSKSLRRGSAADIMSPGPSSDYDDDYEPADSPEPSTHTSTSTSANSSSSSVSTESPPPSPGSFA
ncbi:hypothetical protein LINGRAHAP2_LOCUS5806 [Linum grandiflorum]